MPDPTINRTPIERVLDEFGFGDGVANATDEDAKALAAEVVRFRDAEMESMTRKYLHRGHGPQTPPDSASTGEQP